MILDFGLIIIAALFVLIGYKKGIMKSLYGLISLVVAGVGSCLLSRFLSGWVYNVFFAESINKSISNSIAGTTESITAATENVFANLPDYVKGFLGFFGVTDSSIFETTQATQALEAELQNTVMSAVVQILGSVLLVVLFILILILMKWLSKFILFIFEVPVIKQINSLCGCIFGLAEGLIICYIAVLLCRLLLPVSDHTVINAEMINSSAIFGKIYYSELITFIVNVFVN